MLKREILSLFQSNNLYFPLISVSFFVRSLSLVTHMTEHINTDGIALELINFIFKLYRYDLLRLVSLAYFFSQS